MPKPKKMRPQTDDRVAFFRAFLKHPQQVASIVPSSRFLERRLVARAGIRSARTIVELGCGTGGTTRAILGAMPVDAKLLTIEINPRFHAIVGRIDDARLMAHLGSAEDLVETVSRYGLTAPDAIVSGIPFSTMNEQKASGILESIAALLAPGGRFVAYQVRNRVETLGRPILGSARVDLELLNLPPVRLFQWEKNAAEPGAAVPSALKTTAADRASDPERRRGRRAP